MRRDVAKCEGQMRERGELRMVRKVEFVKVERHLASLLKRCIAKRQPACGGT